MENDPRILPIICDVPGCGVQLGTYTMPEFTDPTGMTLSDFGINGALCDTHKPAPVEEPVEEVVVEEEPT